ncbi:MAG: DnaB-like helicase C-terminal domain-containing protein [Byssovorax sp.]
MNTTRHEPASIAGRVPPHNLDAEAAVLAAVFLSREALDRVIEILKPAQFYSDANGRIFEAALGLAAVGSPVDIVSVASWLRNRDRLAQVGGASYLAQLADATPAVADAEAHARLVIDAWRLRALVATCQKIAAEGYGSIADAGEFIAAAEEAIMLSTATEADERTPTLGEAIEDRVEDIIAGRAAVGGIGTGLDDVDRQLGPMLPCNFVVIGAHSGIGKTTLAMQIAQHTASVWAVDPETNKPMPCTVLVCSMEMSRAELADRSVLSVLGIDTSKAARNMLTDDEKAKLENIAVQVRTRGIFGTLHLDDRGNLTPHQIRAAARRSAIRGRREGAPLRLVVVDYLQLCDGSTGGRGQERREREVSYVAEQMKALAKELRIVVLGVAQLNEDARTANRLPRGEDLRESKSIRAHADKVILMHNESALERRTAPRTEGSAAPAEIVDIIVDKNRGVPEGSVCVMFWPSTSAFTACAPIDEREHRATRKAREEAQRGARGR